MKKKTLIFMIMGISLIWFLNIFSETKTDANANSPLFKYSLEQSIKRLENTTPANNDNIATLYGGKCVSPMSDTTETLSEDDCNPTYYYTCVGNTYPTCFNYPTVCYPTCSGYLTCDYTCNYTCAITCGNTCGNCGTAGPWGLDSTCKSIKRYSSKDIKEYYY